MSETSNTIESNTVDNTTDNVVTEEKEEPKKQVQITRDELLENLQIIGNIKKNQKLYIISGKTYVDIDTSYSLTRTLNYYMSGSDRGYDRESTFNFVKAIVKTATSHIEMMKQQGKNDDDLSKKLIGKLPQCIEGLRNLSHTYESDEVHTARISNLINKIDDCLKKYHN